MCIFRSQSGAASHPGGQSSEHFTAAGVTSYRTMVVNDPVEIFAVSDAHQDAATPRVTLSSSGTITDACPGFIGGGSTSYTQ